MGVVPGGGVDAPRPEGRRILSPLRLPVPPSRLGKACLVAKSQLRNLGGATKGLVCPACFIVESPFDSSQPCWRLLESSAASVLPRRSIPFSGRFTLAILN